ncbi:MAG: zinc-ribbon domain-containing protein [Deltaproteobacteria bacterium]|jgi:transcription elongation factor Elf1|nr:zinc-ribbon domain-containing protein [Deltaproteobacteria bacterium]
MKITCPACSFTREVDEGKLQPSAAFATCPQCKKRFRFREPELAGLDEASASSASERAGEDEPPGASAAQDEQDEQDAQVERDDDDQEARRQAAEAYRRAADLPHDGQERDEADNPWEDPRAGYPAAFHQTALLVLFAAPRFFAGLEPQKTLSRALVFYVIVGLVQIVAEQFWLGVFVKLSAQRAESDPQFAQLLALLSHGMSLPFLVLARTAFISVELFVVAALYHWMFRMIAPTRADFSLVFQVVAYASAPALLAVIPVLGSFAGFVWSIACSFAGCRYALRISWRQTLLALVPLYLFALYVFLQLSVAARGL